MHREILNKLGIGHKTGIDLPGETSGYLLPLKDWTPVTRATIGYGYGIATTPIQVAAAVASIANDGIWITPHVIKYPKNIAKSKIKRKRTLRYKSSRDLYFRAKIL